MQQKWGQQLPIVEKRGPVPFFLCSCPYLTGLTPYRQTYIMQVMAIDQNVIFAGAISLLSVLLFLILGRIKEKSLLHYLLVCIPYLIVIYPYLHSPYLPPDGDTIKNFFREFDYLAKAVAHLHYLPEWFPSCGGIRLGFFHLMSVSLPYRLFGYYLYAIIDGDVMFPYKLQYILSILCTCFGWWLVLRRLTHCRYAAFFGTLMILMGGTGLAFYQEQVVSTIYLIPWLLLSIMKIQDDSSYIFPAAILLGLSINAHLPQIQIISWGLFIFLVSILNPRPVTRLYKERMKSILVIMLLFILAILPTLYLARNINNLSSPHRKSEKIFVKDTYEEYLETNCEGYSSAVPEYFKQYIDPVYWGPVNKYPGIPPLDCQAFYVGRLAFILIIIALIFNFRKAMPILILLICFVLLCLGKNSIIPVLKFFYTIHFPFLRIFREWYHFFPMVNFSLSALAAVGLAALVRFSRRNKITRISFFLLITPLLFMHIVDLAHYDKRWLSTYTRARVPWDNLRNFKTIRAIEGCGSGFFFQYKNRYRLSYSYPQAIPAQSFLTTRVLNVESNVEEEFKRVSEITAKEENLVVTNIPGHVIDTFSIGNRIVHMEVGGSLNYGGLSFDISVPENSLLVTPLNFDLGVNGYVDGKKVDVWRVNSALCGILAEKGRHRIELEIAPDAYVLIIWSQMLLYLFLVGFFVYKYRRKG